MFVQFRIFKLQENVANIVLIFYRLSGICIRIGNGVTVGSDRKRCSGLFLIA